MIISNSGRQIDSNNLTELETQLNAKLSDEYRNFLLTYNGGIPSPDTIDVPNAPGTPTDVQVFFGIGRSIQSSDLYWNYLVLCQRFSSLEALPIACDSGGNIFCLRFGIVGNASIFYCDLSKSECMCYEVSVTFNEFIAKIRDFDQQSEIKVTES